MIQNKLNQIDYAEVVVLAVVVVGAKVVVGAAVVVGATVDVGAAAEDVDGAWVVVVAGGGFVGQ